MGMGTAKGPSMVHGEAIEMWIILTVAILSFDWFLYIVFFQKISSHLHPKISQNVEYSPNGEVKHPENDYNLELRKPSEPNLHEILFHVNFQSVHFLKIARQFAPEKTGPLKTHPF